MTECRICGTRDSHMTLKIKEMMYGTREEFDYLICNKCKCIQISTIPSDLYKYYPHDYYSFNNSRKVGIIKRLKQRMINIQSFMKGDFHKLPDFASFGFTYNDRNKYILDIGCGDGSLLFRMKNWGFCNLTGIDPFIRTNYSDKRVTLLNINPENLEGNFDIIMSHHSLEHMTDPDSFFKFVHRQLKTDGKLILRIPIYPNYIWEKFSTKWIQLDPPRHLYTFSIQSINYICNKNKLVIKNLFYDSHAWSLAGTEFCLNGRPYKEFEQNVVISEEQYTECNKANEMNYGDSVCFTITKRR